MKRSNSRAGLAGATLVIDEGEWWDLGTRDAYLDAHLAIAGSSFPGYLDGPAASPERAAEGADIAKDAEIDKASHVGHGARIGAGAKLVNSVVWPGAEVAGGAELRRCVVLGGHSTSGHHEGADL